MISKKSINSSIFYYSRLTLNKYRLKEYLLCFLASSDLTFTSLNSDLYFLKRIVILLNPTKSILFLLFNGLIFTYYSKKISIVNTLMSIILMPYHFYTSFWLLDDTEKGDWYLLVLKTRSQFKKRKTITRY